MLPLAKRYLSDEQRTRLYREFPNLGEDYTSYCPTCLKKGTYTWQGVEYECDCKTQLNLHKQYLWAGIGNLYQRYTWDDFTGDDKLKDEVQFYVKNHDKLVPRGIGYILVGPYGIGKTMAMNLLLKDLLREGYSVFATTFANMIEMFTAGWKSKEDKDYFEERVKKSDILLLDDIGKEMRFNTKLPESTFDNVLRTRVQNSLPTFITTNEEESGLLQGYGAAVMSLLRESAHTIEVYGKDYRAQASNRAITEALSGEIRPIV